MLVTDGFMDAASRTPAKVALVFQEWAITYGEMAARVSQVAAALSRAFEKDGAGRRVGLLLPNGPDFLELFMGSSAAGSAAMVLDPSWSEAELRKVTSETPPDLLFTNAEWVDRVGASFPPDRTILVGGPDHPSKCPAYEDWLERVFSGDYAAPDCDDGELPFYIGFTSGTTGHPKGFVRSHRSWTLSFDSCNHEFGIGVQDHVLVPGPLMQSLFLFAALHAFSVGATVYLLPRFKADAAYEALRRYPITCVNAVPTMLAALLQAALVQKGRGREEVFSTVRSVLSSGSRLDVRLKERLPILFPAADIVDYFGASELSYVSVLSSRDGAPRNSVGRPFHGVEVSIRRDDGSCAEVGEVGRLFVRSGTFFSGYLRAQDGDALYLDDGWASIGDYAYLDGEGFIYLAGRENDMLISGGLNVFPGEIEAVLNSMPEIAEAAVIGLPDPYWGDVVAAVIRWHGNARPSRAEIDRRCQAFLARFKCPKRLYETTEFPYTSTGKLVRRIVRDRVLESDPTIRELS